MSILIQKVKKSFQREGFRGLFIKSFNRIKGIILMSLSSYKKDRERWKNLKNKFEGEEVFLIGAGPSINKTPLYYLKDKYTMVFNRFFYFSDRINWHPNFYLTTDDRTFNDVVDEINKYIPLTAYAFFPKIHFRGKNFRSKIQDFPNVFWIRQLFGKGFSTKLPEIYPGSSVVYEGIQILNYLGFKKIFLLGVDMNFQIQKSAKIIGKGFDAISESDDDPNHFDPRYCGKGSKFRQPEQVMVDNIIAGLEYISNLTDDLGIEIINAGYDSKLEAFPRTDFENIFKYTEAEKENLFSSLLLKDTDYGSIKQFEDNAIFYDGSKEFVCPPSNFYSTAEQGIELIQKVIYTHNPVGPFQNKYYFKNKKN